MNPLPFLRAWRVLVVLVAASCWCAAQLGCKKEPVPEVPADPAANALQATPLRVLVLDDEPLATALERHWRATAEQSIEVHRAAAADVLGPDQKKLDADAVIYPAGLIGELAERQLIAALPDEALAGDKFDARDILEMARLREVTWGEKVFAVPLGSPQLTLFYRADIFERLQLKPPTTWAEYQRLAELLTNRERLGDLAPPADQPWHGTAEPLGPGWAGQMLLARAAAYARHRSHYSTLFDFSSMAPLIDGPPFVKALEELVAAAKFASPQATNWTPHDVRREFLAGRTAMAVTWPTRAIDSAKANDDAQQSDESRPAFAIACAELPGAREMFNFRENRWEQRGPQDDPHVPLLSVAGRLGSVTKESARARSTLNLLVLLSGADWSVQVLNRSQDTTLFRQRHLAAPRAWIDESFGDEAAQQFAKVTQESHKHPAWLFSVRIPGRRDYLAALDEATQQAIRGDSPPADSLHTTAARWREITTRLGEASQRRAYRRSLGLELD